MKQQWQTYSDKFLQMTEREQFLVLLTGLVAVFFIMSYLFIDDKAAKIETFDKQSRSMQASIRNLKSSNDAYKMALEQDPDHDTTKQIEQLERKLAKLDKELVLLTTDIISPIEMRTALIKLLELEPGVSLLSFELLGAESLLNIDKTATDDTASANTKIAPTKEQLGVNLFKHGIKIKLSGKYFQLRNYLLQLEQMSWKFFWQDLNFEVKEYPVNEVEITIYSLGLNKEFIGV